MVNIALIFLALHIVVCVLLVILILLQSGKEGMGVIFGGGNIHCITQQEPSAQTK